MSREILMDPALFTFHPSDTGASYQSASGKRYSSTPADKAQTTDSYFEPEPTTSALGHIVDDMVERLPERQRLCIELRVFARMPYSQIAKRMDFYCGGRDCTCSTACQSIEDCPSGQPPYPNKKKAWRSVHRALDTLEAQLREIDPKLADNIGLILPKEDDE